MTDGEWKDFLWRGRFFHRKEGCWEAAYELGGIKRWRVRESGNTFEARLTLEDDYVCSSISPNSPTEALDGLLRIIERNRPYSAERIQLFRRCLSIEEQKMAGLLESKSKVVLEPPEPEVRSSDPFVSLFFDLMRDQVPFGTLEKFVDRYEKQAVSWHGVLPISVFKPPAHHLGAYAVDLARRLRKLGSASDVTEVPPPAPESSLADCQKELEAWKGAAREARCPTPESVQKLRVLVDIACRALGLDSGNVSQLRFIEALNTLLEWRDRHKSLQSQHQLTINGQHALQDTLKEWQQAAKEVGIGAPLEMQQAMRKAHAACTSLGLPYAEASPADIERSIQEKDTELQALRAQRRSWETSTLLMAQVKEAVEDKLKQIGAIALLARETTHKVPHGVNGEMLQQVYLGLDNILTLVRQHINIQIKPPEEKKEKEDESRPPAP